MSWRSTGLHSTEAEEVNPENSHMVRGDKVVLLVGLHEADLLEERGQAVEDGGGQPGVEGEALDQQVVALLQAGDGLYDGSDQPDLVVLDFSRDESSSGLPKFVALKYLITTNACNYVLAYKKYQSRLKI